MGALWRPVGPYAEAVYWRRRLVLVAGVVLVLLVLRSCATGPDSTSPTSAGRDAPATPTASATSTSTPTPTARATATAAASAAPLPQCRDSELAVTVEPAPGSPPPSFVVTVASRSARPCTRDLGPGAVDLVVTSGQDRIWARSDCDRREARQVATLAPGQRQAVRVAWNGKRSRPGCPAGGAAASVGTYRVSGKVASKPIAPVVFRVG